MRFLYWVFERFQMDEEEWQTRVHEVDGRMQRCIPRTSNQVGNP
jgi:hypothetical protein